MAMLVMPVRTYVFSLRKLATDMPMALRHQTTILRVTPHTRHFQGSPSHQYRQQHEHNCQHDSR